MELICPCGNGYLIRKVTAKKGPNFGRPFYKCPGSDKGNDITDCMFFSFEDELKHCPCGRGFCRNVFRGKMKYWSCCVTGGDSCGFFSMIMSNWPLQLTPPTRSQSSPSSSSSQGARGSLMSSNELLSRSLQLVQASTDGLVSLIQEFAGCELQDFGPIQQGAGAGDGNTSNKVSAPDKREVEEKHQQQGAGAGQEMVLPVPVTDVSNVESRQEIEEGR